MQVLSCQRGVSLIGMREPANASGRSFECASVAAGQSRRSRMAQATVRQRARGFTLVELMITVAIAVVLIMIAVPSFKTITLSNKLTTTANDLVGAINSARMEAVKRNTSTQVCSNSSSANTSDTLGGACTDSSGVVETGAVYVLTTPQPTQVLAGTPGITTPLQLNGDMTALRFTSQGLGQQAGTSTPYSNTVVDICTSQMSTNNHRVITMTAGSILATTTTSGACPSS
jgi:type IV fimbrial biogenesis protein FimT